MKDLITEKRGFYTLCRRSSIHRLPALYLSLASAKDTVFGVPPMPRMTMTEKILAKHAQKAAVSPGENIWVNVDVLMTHDVCGPGTIGVFHEHFGRNAKVWNPDKVVVIPDHYIFTKELICHRNVQILRDFVKEQGLKYYYDPEFVTMEPTMPNPYKDPTKTNYKGVCHKEMPEEGHVRHVKKV